MTILVDNPGTVWKCVNKDILLLLEDEDIEYLMFGEEYRLIKPLYNIVTAKKYNGSLWF